MKDFIKATGIYYFEAYDLDGSRLPEKDYVKKNVIVQNFFTGVFQFLAQSSSGVLADAMNVSHIATGTGTNIATKTDTVLQTEVFRKPVSSRLYGLNTFTVKLALNPEESVTTIREVGIFMKATDTAGTGTLMSRVNVNIEKTAQIKYLVTYVLTLQ